MQAISTLGMVRHGDGTKKKLKGRKTRKENIKWDFKHEFQMLIMLGSLYYKEQRKKTKFVCGDILLK